MSKIDFQFLIYRSAEEDVSVNAVIKDETIWLTQKAMTELFDCSTDNISLHLKNIFAEGTLTKEAVTEKISATASDGKNYLTQFCGKKQIRRLERTVTGHFDYVEDLIGDEHIFIMEDFATSINEFLAFRKYKILSSKGRVSSQAAKEKAESEYAAFNKAQRITSDFDREVKRLLDNETEGS